MKTLTAIETFFLRNLTVTGVYHFRARLLVKFILVSILFAAGYWINTYYTYFLAARFVMIAVIFLFAFQLLWLRTVRDQFWVAQFYTLTCWLTIAVLALCSGGIWSYVLPWMTLVPVVALMLMGQRSALFWGAVGTASIIVAYAIQGSYSIPLKWQAPQSDLLTASLGIGLITIVLFMISVFHAQGSKLLATIQEQQEIIARKNAEIAQRNETLESEVDRRTKELLDYNQQLEQFAFISSHNLRAPVASLLGLGHLLEVSTGNKEEVEQICLNMISTTRELDRVVRDLSTILETRKPSHAVLTQLDLEEEVKLVKVSLEREIRETGAKIQTDFRRAPSIRTVRPLMDSILMNLISNAIKYRHPDREPLIFIRTERSEGVICLTVTDNGLGIDLELFGDKLFTLYGRFHSHVDGKGLGLYLVKTHVMAMGGRIEVASTPGDGTVFSLFLKDSPSGGIS